ncbi:MAG: hypothetical protein R2764_09895 [Bacteroidales bacterium]
MIREIWQHFITVAGDALYYFCKADIPRGMDPELLKKMAIAHGLTGGSFPTVQKAYKEAKEKASADDLVFIGGSTFVVAEVV